MLLIVTFPVCQVDAAWMFGWQIKLTTGKIAAITNMPARLLMLIDYGLTIESTAGSSDGVFGCFAIEKTEICRNIRH
jgi:hypothetical protein